MDQIPFYENGGTIDMHRLIGRVEIDALRPNAALVNVDRSMPVDIGARQRLTRGYLIAMLDKADIDPYCIDEYIIFQTIGKYQVLDLEFNPEDAGGGMEAKAGLAHFISLRADLLEGDFRLPG